jgi:hypothetical protein
MEQYLRELGARGYCVVPRVYDPSKLTRAVHLVRELAANPIVPKSGDVPYLAQDSPILWNLQFKDPYFLEILFEAEDVERILVHFLNDRWYKRIPPDEPNYILRSYVARSSVDPLPLHIDSFVPYTGDTVISMQCAILLEDMSPENGATLVVPGSHRSGEYVEQSAMKDAVSIEAKAGDVALWDSRLWHGAGENRSGRTRWTLTATFTRWWIKQAFNLPQNLPQSIYERLSPKHRAILGYCSIPYDDESVGIDMRRGYESLRPHVSTYGIPSSPSPALGEG